MLQDMPDVPSAHPDDWGLPNTESPGFTVTARDIGENHLPNTTCLTLVFFKSDEHFGEV